MLPWLKLLSKTDFYLAFPHCLWKNEITMKKILVVLLLLLVIGFGLYYFLKIQYPNSILNSYSPQGPSYQTEETKGQVGYPARQLDQAADVARTTTIESGIQPALNQYYKMYQKAPTSLDVLVSEGILTNVPKDPLTDEAPKYSSDFPERGCKAWHVLSDGTEVAAYCY